jgi:hypothetical protein
MSGAASPHARRWPRVAGVVPLAALVVALALDRRRDVRDAPPDEAYWIGSAYYFDLVRRGAVAHPDWSLLPARENPPAGKYLFGLALLAGGRRVDSLDALGAWMLPYTVVCDVGTPADRAKRRALVERMRPAVRAVAGRRRFVGLAPADVALSRGLTLGAGLTAALLVGAIGRRVGGRAVGVLAAGLFALQPAVVGSYSYAMVDILALAPAIGAVLVLCGLVEPGAASGGRRLARGLLLGGLLGLAVGAKLNALVVAIVAAAAGLAAAWRAARGDADARRALAGLIVGGAVSVAVFVGINPAFYPDVVGGIRGLFAELARAAELQRMCLPDALDTPAAKLRAVAALGGTGWGPPWAELGVCLAVAAWRSVVAWRSGPAARRVVAAWFWIALALVAAWIPFPWERYALPVVPPAALLLADGLVAATRWRPRRGTGRVELVADV